TDGVAGTHEAGDDLSHRGGLGADTLIDDIGPQKLISTRLGGGVEPRPPVVHDDQPARLPVYTARGRPVFTGRPLQRSGQSRTEQLGAVAEVREPAGQGRVEGLGEVDEIGWDDEIAGQ